VSADEMTIETSGGVVAARLLDRERVTVDMGPPRLEPVDVPLLAPGRAASYSVDVGDERIRLGAVSMGNPHAVIVVDDVEAAPVERLGSSVQALPCFPRSVNVGFMQMVADDRIRLRVYERGVGETRACGSGACAAVVVGRLLERLGPAVDVELPGGILRVEWAGAGDPVGLPGPSAWVFEGDLQL
jgi:diaminopimelate epimerase